MNGGDVVQWLGVGAALFGAGGAWAQARAAKLAAAASDGKAREANNLAAAANQLARDANALAETAVGEAHLSNKLSAQSNQIAVDANRLAEQANDLATDMHGRQTEDHVVRFDWDVIGFGVVEFTNKGHHDALDVVIQIEVSAEGRTRAVEIRRERWGPKESERVDVSQEANALRRANEVRDRALIRVGGLDASGSLFWDAAWKSQAGVRHTQDGGSSLTGFGE